MEQERKGFIAPQITEDNHIFGSIGIALPIIKVDGDWTKFLSDPESQLEQSFDSDGCTVYGTSNAVETLEKYLYDEDYNHSDRFLYNAVRITPPGSDPHLVATTWRGVGAVDQIDLPDETPTLAEFMTPRPLPVDLRIKGQKWLNKQMLGHQWLWNSKPDQTTRLALLKEALTKGTVCVSVSAWWKNDQGLYYSPSGTINGHWTHVYNIDDTGIYVFDSYAPFLKKLTLDHNIEFAKVYFFTVPDKQQFSLIGFIISLLQFVGIMEKSVVVPVVPTSTEKTRTYEELNVMQKDETPTKITLWASLIDKLEGSDPKLSNPGNFKYSELIRTFGGLKGPPGSDGGNFAYFKTREEGFNALIQFLILGCKDQLASYHNARTIKQFTLVYTNHPKPQFDYSDTLIKQLGVAPDTLISTFL